MEHLAVVGWQDLVVLRPFMGNNPIYTRKPFNNDDYGFLTFEAELNAILTAAPSAAAVASETAARIRGDLQTAEVIRSLIPVVAVASRANALEGSPMRMIRGIHAAVTDPLGGRDSVADVPRQQLHFSREPTVDIQNASTWPIVQSQGTLPLFATSFEFSHASSLAELRDEYLFGRLLSNGQRLPSVKQLELSYGPQIRTGSVSMGSSYRSKRVNGSQRKDNDFARRRPFYQIVDSEGDAGVERLLDQIKASSLFQLESWKSTAWLLDELRIGRVASDPVAKKKSEGAKAGAFASKKRHRGDAPVIEIEIASPFIGSPM